jgi:hypothetical protein
MQSGHGDESTSAIMSMNSSASRSRDLDALRGAVGIFSCWRCFVSADCLDTPHHEGGKDAE